MLKDKDIQLEESNFFIAEYKKHPTSMFNGNPLIESLPAPLSAHEFKERLTFKLDIEKGITDLDKFYRILSIGSLVDNYLPEPMLLTLYKSIYSSLFSGYLHRNPIERNTIKDQFQIATDSEFKVKNISRMNQCIGVIGISGRGKTLGTLKCLEEIPQVIKHTEYQKKQLCFLQVVWLYFETPTTRTQKGFILSFFSAIDEAIGTKYYDEWKTSRSSVATFIHQAKKIAFNHFVGIVFIDEIQRCVSSSSSADKTTLEFIDAFFNSLGIPIIIAGTYASKPLFETTMSTARRLTSGRYFDFDIFEEDDVFWGMLVQSYYYPALLKEEFTFDDDFISTAYQLSAGLPAILCRLMKLSYEIAIETDIERLSCDLLNQVYSSQFEVLNPALNLLRNRQYMEYEDLYKFKGFGTQPNSKIQQLIEKNFSFNNEDNSETIDDDGLYLDLSDNQDDQITIPKDDYRNFKGHNKENIIKKLKGKKS